MNTSNLLLITATGAAGLSFSISWLSASVSNRRAVKSDRLHASVSASNQAVITATTQLDLLKRICDAGKNETGYLRMSVIDRFGNVIFDTDGNESIIDDAVSQTLSSIFEKAQSDNPVILRRSLLDYLVTRNSVSIVLQPIFAEGKAELLLCGVGKSNQFVDKQHLALVKEFAGDIAFGMKALALEQHKQSSTKRINIMGKLFNESKDGIAVTDINGFIIEANKSYCDINSINQSSVKNKIINEFSSPEKRQRIQQKLAIDSVWTGERIITRHGKSYLSSIRITAVRHEADDTQLLVMLIDHYQNDEFKAEVNYLQNHDLLTGLPNKKNFQLQAQERLNNCVADRKHLAFFYIAVNEFNYINETVWDKNSEDIIKLLASKIVGVLKQHAIISRVGNSDFLIAIEVDNKNHAHEVAETLLQCISITCQVEKVDVELTPMIGVSIFPENGNTMNELASASQKVIKNSSFNRAKRIKFAQAEHIVVDKHEEIKFENNLKKSIALNQLELYYQPQVHLKNGNVIGYEALIRWNCPINGLVPPDSFIPIAEKNGFIIQIGHWVINEACKQISIWKKANHRNFKIGVNVSPIQFFDDDLVPVIKKCIEDYEIKPCELELEITESAIMEDESRAIRVLNEIRNLGVILSIDDFGVGRSSLAYLKKLPVHNVKIDRSFVNDLPHDKHSASIVKAIMNIADDLNMNVVAEGIETKEQEDFMKNLDCLHGQGLLYGMPVKAVETVY